MYFDRLAKIACFMIVSAPLCAEHNDHHKEKMHDKHQMDDHGFEGELFASASALYYYITEDALEAGLVYQINTTTDGLQRQFQGNFIAMDFQWTPGFKLNFGYRSPQKNPWEIFLEYFQVASNTSTEASQPPEGLLSAGWLQHDINQLTPPSSNFVSAEWKLNTYILDLLVTRVFYPYDMAAVRPLFGLRAAWINQSYGLISLDSTSIENDLNSSSTSRSGAIGFKAGLDSNWFLGWGFSFYGKINASILYTHYDITKNEVKIPSSPFFDISYNHSTTKANTDLSLGFTWEGTPMKKTKMFMRTGYDFAIFFDQNLIRAVSDEGGQLNGGGSSSGSLYMQGLDVQFGLSF